MDVDRAVALADAERERALEDLVTLVAIPSVSADPARRGDVRAAAEWIAGRLTGLGLEASIVTGNTHPTVVGEWLGAPGAPTLALYSHYDVQPVDPLSAWEGQPFDAQVRGEFIHGRGVRDDKGQLVAVLRAIEYAMRTGAPPVNLRVFFEGEEEITGTSLGELLRANAEQWRVDCALIVDGEFAAPGWPTIVAGLRGVLSVQIDVAGVGIDRHSGLYGGVAPNALVSLTRILAGLKGTDGRVTVPSFYDDVRPLDPEEVVRWRGLPITEASLLEELGSPALEGEADHTPLERIWARPTFDLHGIVGGHMGEGLKTVIPARARATCSFRLVPDQDPGRILGSLEAHVQGLAGPAVSARVHELGACRPARFDTVNAGVLATSRALEQTFGRPTLLGRLGGSIPVSADFQESITPNVVIVGFGLPGDGGHSPMERFSLSQFHGATRAILRVMHELAVVGA